MFSKKLLAEQLTGMQFGSGKSLRQSAKEIGISASTLSRLNNEQITPDLDTLYKCAKWCGVKLEYFFI